MEDQLANDDSALSAAESRLEALEQERFELLERIKRLRVEKETGAGGSDMSRPPGSSVLASSGVAARATVNRGSSADERVALFASLFRGRMDVYARRWENQRVGRSGFQPACANEWAAGICDKRRNKCGSCPNREFLPLTPAVIRDHLRGEREGEHGREFVVGIYPLLADETCWFLALDFDGPSWKSRWLSKGLVPGTAAMSGCSSHVLPAVCPRKLRQNWLRSVPTKIVCGRCPRRRSRAPAEGCEPARRPSSVTRPLSRSNS